MFAKGIGGVDMFAAFKRDRSPFPASPLFRQRFEIGGNIGQAGRFRDIGDFVTCFAKLDRQVSVFTGSDIPTSEAVEC